MNEILKATMIEIAKNRSFITYQQLSDQCNLGLDMVDIAQRKILANKLGEISTIESNAGRPLLSVVVFSQINNQPGNGFFTLANQLGLYHGGNNPGQRDIFFINELNKCYNYWANH